MYTQITEAGQALIDASTGPVTLTRYVLGTGYGYTIDATVAGLSGSVVYENVPAPLKIEDAQTYRTGIYLGHEVGPFEFGEIALYSGATLFAVCVNPVPIQKKKQSSSNEGTSLKLDIYLQNLGENIDMFTLMSEASNEFRLAVFPTIDMLPQAANATPNAYVIRGASSEQSSFMAYADKEGLWNFDAYEISNIKTTVLAAAERSITISRSAWDDRHNPEFVGQEIVQFLSGGAWGLVRYITSATVSIDGSKVVLGFATPLAITPEAGEKIAIYTRDGAITTGLQEIPIATATILGGIKQKITQPAVVIDANGVIDLAAGAVVKTVNGQAPNAAGDIAVAGTKGEGGASLNSLRFSFAVAMEEWTIAHNQNSDRFILVTRDENGNRFYAGEQVIDLNTIRIQGTEPMRGTADLLFM